MCTYEQVKVYYDAAYTYSEMLRKFPLLDRPQADVHWERLKMENRTDWSQYDKQGPVK